MKQFAPVLVLVSAVLWGSMGIVTRYVASFGFSTMQTTTIRLGSATIALLLFQSIRDIRKLKIHAADIKWFLGLGIFSLLLNNAAYAATVQRASLSVAVVLLYTAPFLVTVMSAFIFKEKITVQKMLALFLAFAGCILTVGVSKEDMGSDFFLTLIIGLAAALGYSLYSILGKVLVKTYDSVTITAYAFVIAFTGALCFAHPGALLDKVAVHAGKLPLIFLGSVITLAVPYVTYAIALRYMESSKASVLASLEVAVASIYGAILYQEPMKLYNVLGIVLMVAALSILQVKPKKQRS